MKMSKQFEKLDEVFNTSDNEEDILDIQVSGSEIVEKNLSDKKDKDIKDDVKKDYEYTRGNLYSIIEKGQEAINSVLELAQETEQARAYEVVGQLIKNVSDATDKLLDLQKKMKDLDEVKNSSGPTNVTNALFIGSTAELSKLLKSQKKDINNK